MGHLFGAVMVARTALGWVKQRWLRIEIHPSPVTLIVLALGVLWANQQAHAALLMRT